MHHLINEYRPHQARYTLCRLVEKQVEKEKEELLAYENVCNDVKNVIDMYQHIHGSHLHEQLPNEANESKMDEEMQDLCIWAAITSKKHDFRPPTPPFDLLSDL